ncbi:hypothetical protein VPNG_05569 [Cytospora leucostoma]|uniref:Uncharacterized protein n=1 Tax=Cytospora leucostoma TaxID=1230097 RepID=A0A423X796_9PEZI|nr:hypothetical protein VPNG_05569 [Cytospora leucostoma]
MPSLRGIEISVLARSEAARLPEFPHPERYPAHTRALAGTAGNGSPPNFLDAPLTKVDTTVSVYIPSVPGAQFWINYVVEQNPLPLAFLFFKLYMNGRHITSWGIDPRIKTDGQVEKALYEPSKRWDHEEDGIILKQNGIEARYFHFVAGQQETSIAEDGGLIEVQVFRAKGRKRRAAKLDQYRQQEQYGIAAPSGGLLDNPQDVTFFDFHLVDPKDAPFASFRFHYRSWENLCQLNLIPSIESSISASSTKDTIIPDISPNTNTDGVLQEEDSYVSTSVHPGYDGSVFDDSGSIEEYYGPIESKSKPRRNSTFVLMAPPQLQPRSATSHNLPQPSKTVRDGVPHGVFGSYLQRPLPDRPLPDLPIPGSVTTGMRRSRGSSTVSAAPSVTPSLLSYVKDGSMLDESVEYGQAQEVQICVRHTGESPNQDKSYPNIHDTSISGYENPPLVEEDSNEGDQLLLSPGNYLASTGCTLEDHAPRLESDHDPPSQELDRSASPGTREAIESIGEPITDFSRFPHLQLSESDWIRRTPSPTIVPRSILSPKRLWSTLRRNKSRSRSPLRDVHGEVMTRNHPTSYPVDRERDEIHGNWI